MGIDRGLVSEAQGPRSSPGGLPADDQRLLLDPAHRSPMAGSAPRNGRPLVHRVRPFPRVETGWNLGPGGAKPGGSAWREGAGRLGAWGESAVPQAGLSGRCRALEKEGNAE